MHAVLRVAYLVRGMAVIALASLLCGCATPVFNHTSNVPITASTLPNMGAPAGALHRNSIMLALSGGGLRAAAFSYGVLNALQSIKTPEGDLLDDVGLINSVSGSSLTAAYFALYGRDGLRRFADDVLRPGFEDGMRVSVNLRNLRRLLGGGVNSGEELRDVMDRDVFRGATFADIYARQGPEIRIHATDLYYRVAFTFVPPQFLLLCSDLSRYSVADAVAASMAVPAIFAPTVVRTFPDACPPFSEDFEPLLHPPPEASLSVKALSFAAAGYRDAAHPKFIKLADGGLTDNYGVSTLVRARAGLGTPYAPLTEQEAVTLRRLLLLVVDASRGPSGDWLSEEAGPTGVEGLLAAADAAIESAAREAADSLARMIAEWQQSVIAYRCALNPEQLLRLGAPSDWQCADLEFALARISVSDLPEPAHARVAGIPTRLTLSGSDIDASIEAAREATMALPALHDYARQRVPSAEH